jgi:ABC-2 type transport system permease protein
MLVLRRKIFWLLLLFASLHFMFLFATIYLKAQIVAENPNFQRFLDQVLSSVTGRGDTYREFMFAQATVTMLMMAFAGGTLVGDDVRHGGLTFYLSRRIGRWHYLVGKMLAISLLVSLTTTLPALILFVQYGLLTDSTSYFLENWTILRGILGYGLAMSVTLSLVLIALASWLPRTVQLVMAWVGLFAFLPLVGGLLRVTLNDRYWLLLSLWRDLRLVGLWCFGAVAEDADAKLLWPAMAIVVGVCVLSLFAVDHGWCHESAHRDCRRTSGAHDSASLSLRSCVEMVWCCDWSERCDDDDSARNHGTRRS